MSHLKIHVTKTTHKYNIFNRYIISCSKITPRRFGVKPFFFFFFALKTIICSYHLLMTSDSILKKKKEKRKKKERRL